MLYSPYNYCFSPLTKNYLSLGKNLITLSKLLVTLFFIFFTHDFSNVNDSFPFNYWYNLYVYLTKKLCLKKIYLQVHYALYGYCIIVRRNYPGKHIPVSNRNTRKWCDLRSEITVKTLKQHWLQVFLLLTLNSYMFPEI